VENAVKEEDQFLTIALEFLIIVLELVVLTENVFISIDVNVSEVGVEENAVMKMCVMKIH